MKIFIFFAIIIFSCFIWYINSDSYILDKGQNTEGVILSVQSRSRTDQYGKVHISYNVLYEFQDLKKLRWRGKFTVRSSRCGFREGDNIQVSYLPNKPHKNAVSRSCK